jgi:hypothetical protein
LAIVVISIVLAGQGFGAQNIYDDFNNSRYDGTFDTSLWEEQSFSVTEKTIAQENGVLNITIDQGEIWLDARDFRIPPEAYYIEVNIMLDSAIRLGDMFIGINTTNKTGIWCGIGNRGETMKFCEFEKPGERAQSLFSGIRASIQKSYHFRFDINTTEKKIDIFFDGQRVGSYRLSEAEKVTGFILWGVSREGPVKGYFDNVKIGLIDE